MLLSTLAAAAVALAPLGAAVTPTPTPTPTPSPSTTAAPTTAPVSPQDAAIIQICAATSIEEIDEALADLAESDLVGRLGGLVDLVVVNPADDITVVGAVQPGEVQRALNCDPGDNDGDGSGAPTTTPPAGDGGNDDGQVGGDGSGGSSVIPSGAPQTGGRPPADSPIPLILAALLAPVAAVIRIRAART